MNLKSKQITLETINICNAGCLPCPREYFLQKLGIMEMDLFKKIIDDVSQYGLELIELCGYGEPFLDHLFFERCAYIKEKLPDTKIYTTSTCSMMEEDEIRNTIEYMDMLKISFYGMSKNTYELIHRGNLKFETSLCNILSLLKKRNTKPYIIGQFVLLEQNRHEKDFWVSFWEDLVDELLIWKPHNWLYKNYRKINHANQVSCGRPFNGPPYIHIDGSVSVCCWDINKQLKVGNLNTQSLKEIMKSKEYNDIRAIHKDGSFKYLICYNCCQTNPDETSLIYSTKNRKVGQMTSNKTELING